MSGARAMSRSPRVSVILTASIGRGDPARALRSVLAQTCRDLEVIVVGDGRCDLAGLPAAGRPNVRLLPPCRRDRAGALNEAAACAKGRYLCCLGDQDVLYPHHAQTLAEALEADADCQVAYSDVYTTVFRPAAHGGREVLGKVLVGARDFDRFYLLGHDHIPPVGLMLRRDLLARAGGLREGLGALVDWDLQRRLAFFTDFLHVPAITAERTVPEGPAGPETDRFAEQLAAVLSARPPKPWPRMADLSIVFAPSGPNARALAALDEIRRRTRVPYELLLALTDADAEGLDDRSAGTVHVAVGPGWPWDARVDKAIRHCQGDCIAILPEEAAPPADAIEGASHALVHHAGPDEAIRLDAPSCGAFGAVFRTRQLLRARRDHPALGIRRSAEAEGLLLRSAGPDELPLAFDVRVQQARAAEEEGNFLQAARSYEAAGERHGNALWMAEAAAAALCRHGERDEQALAACRRVNEQRPTVASLLLEATILRRNHHVDGASALLERARDALDWTADREPAPC